MKIHQIRNATVMLEHAGKKILVDSMLSDKGALSAFILEVSNEIHLSKMKSSKMLTSFF